MCDASFNMMFHVVAMSELITVNECDCISIDTIISAYGLARKFVFYKKGLCNVEF